MAQLDWHNATLGVGIFQPERHAGEDIGTVGSHAIDAARIAEIHRTICNAQIADVWRLSVGVEVERSTRQPVVGSGE